MLKAAKVIKKLKLQLNKDEGGYFASTYPPADTKNPPCSAIYYFLEKEQRSVLHSVTSDMLYHFYCGGPVEMLLLYPKGHVPQTEVCVFSNNLEKGELPMKVIPAGTWLGSRVKKGAYTLMGVSMAPAFNPDPKFYVIGERDKLIKEYPGRKKMIIALTKDPNEEAKK